MYRINRNGHEYLMAEGVVLGDYSLRVVISVPDAYRGDPTCLEVIRPFKVGQYVTPSFGGDSAHEVVGPDGLVGGLLETHHGNGGQGGVAAQYFYPIKGMEERGYAGPYYEPSR